MKLVLYTTWACAAVAVCLVGAWRSGEVLLLVPMSLCSAVLCGCVVRWNRWAATISHEF